MRRFTALSVLALLASCGSREVTSVARQPASVVTTLRGAFAFTPSAMSALKVSVPERASGALHVGADESTWIEVSPRGARDVAKSVVDGVSVYAGALDDLDLAYVVESARVEELRVAHTRAAASHASWDLRFGPNVAAVRVRDGRVEVLDSKGVVRLNTEPAWASDAKHVRRALELRLDGSTLHASLDASDLTPPIAIDPAWTKLASMLGIKVGGRAMKLASGKVIVAGGSDTNESSTVEIYDPGTNSWSAGTPMKTPCGNAQQMIPVLGSTKLLVTASRQISGGGSTFLSTSELYDPVAGTSVTSSMGVASRDHSATLLADGRVVLVGGTDNSGNWNESIRIWKPSDNTWTTVPLSCCGSPWSEGRVDQAATQLADGRVFVTGGRSRPGGSSSTRVRNEAFFFNPDTNALTAAAGMPVPRLIHGQVQLTVGSHKDQVLVFGGQIRSLDETSTLTSSGALVYDITKDSWALAPFMADRRSYFSYTSLGNGSTLVTGGIDALGIVFSAYKTAEIFDPISFAWKSAGTLTTARGGHAEVLLDANTVFLAGGVSGAKEGFFEYAQTSEKFTLQDSAASCAAHGECKSGFCVDGVCCNTACTDQCAACDVTGKVGTCSPVVGAPHGARTACSTDAKGTACELACNGTDTTACKFPGTTTTCSADACAGGVETHASTCNGAGKCGDTSKTCGDFVCGAKACKTACETKADCVSASTFCQSGKCLPLLSNGLGCTTNDACASGFCVDGTCCESKCEEQCAACDVPGFGGKCVAVKGKPHGTRTACAKDAADACNNKVCDGASITSCVASVGPCGDYSCDALELVCKKACANDDDCSTGRECSAGKCVPRTSKCSSNRVDVIAADGVTRTPCAPYLCSEGVCQTECKSSSDCQGGFVCDPSQKCVAVATAAPSGDDGGGCTMGTSGSGRGGALWLALAGLLAPRRRRRVL